MQCLNSHSILRNYKQIFLWLVWLLSFKGNSRQLWRYLPSFTSPSRQYPFRLFWLPKQNIKILETCIPAFPAVKVKGRGISPATNSGLSPPAAHFSSQSPMMSLLSFQLAGVHKSLLLKKLLHSSIPSSTTEVK